MLLLRPFFYSVTVSAQNSSSQTSTGTILQFPWQHSVHRGSLREHLGLVNMSSIKAQVLSFAHPRGRLHLNDGRLYRKEHLLLPFRRCDMWSRVFIEKQDKCKDTCSSSPNSLAKKWIWSLRNFSSLKTGWGRDHCLLTFISNPCSEGSETFKTKASRSEAKGQ